MYRSNWYYSAKSFKKNFYIDITNQFNNKIKLISSFESEMKRTKSIWKEKIKNECIINGQMIDKKYAEAFELVEISTAFNL